MYADDDGGGGGGGVFVRVFDISYGENFGLRLYSFYDLVLF